MASEEKTFLLVGGLAVTAIIVISLIKNSQANAAQLALNEPGLEGQAPTPGGVSGVLESLLSGGTLGSIGSSLGNVGSGISNLFSGGSSSDSTNDPGLETTDSSDYDGTDDYSDLTADNSFDSNDSGVESLTYDD